MQVTPLLTCGFLPIYPQFYVCSVRGIISDLCFDKNNAIVRYTLLEDSKQIFASRYKLYLPTEEGLCRALEQERAQFEIEEKLKIE